MIGPGIDSKSGERAEWARARAEAQPNRVAKQAAGAVVSDLRRVRKVEACRLDRFERQIDACDLLVRATQRPEDRHVILRFGKDNPFAAAGFHERADGEAQACLPNT